jgi:hypothetical protein
MDCLTRLLRHYLQIVFIEKWDVRHGHDRFSHAPAHPYPFYDVFISFRTSRLSYRVANISSQTAAAPGVMTPACPASVDKMSAEAQQTMYPACLLWKGQIW